MGNKVLVAYASKYGATAEIAEKIGDVLSQAGLQADVLPVKRIRDLSPYKAVVLGSAVYIGLFRREAVVFLKANEKLLSELPVWIFSSGPTDSGDPKELMDGWLFPKALQPVIDSIKPLDITVFHGMTDKKKLNFIEKWMLNNVNAKTGDFRDWDLIASWAETIAGELVTK